MHTTHSREFHVFRTLCHHQRVNQRANVDFLEGEDTKVHALTCAQALERVDSLASAFPGSSLQRPIANDPNRSGQTVVDMEWVLPSCEIAAVGAGVNDGLETDCRTWLIHGKTDR